MRVVNYADLFRFISECKPSCSNRTSKESGQRRTGKECRQRVPTTSVDYQGQLRTNKQPQLSEPTIRADYQSRLSAPTNKKPRPVAATRFCRQAHPTIRLRRNVRLFLDQKLFTILTGNPARRLATARPGVAAIGIA